MKKTKLNEEVKKLQKMAGIIKENEGFDKRFLKLGEYYQVYDPGMDTWNDDYEYLGFDTNSREYMFRTSEGPTNDNFHFVGVPQNELNSDVRPSEM